MASKTLLLLGFLFAVMFLVSSEVAARELAEEIKEKKTENVDYMGRPCKCHDNGGNGGCFYRCCRRGSNGQCLCCTHPDEVPDPEYQVEPLS